MLNIAKDLGTAQGISESLLYEATVVENDDQKSADGRKLCRIRARIKGIFDGIDDADLPWAIPDFIHADGASSTSGSQDIPKIGTKVLLSFQKGSIEHPIYTGYIVDKTTSLSEMDLNYPDRKVIRYQNNLLIVIDTKTNEIFIRNPGTFNLFIEGDANIEVVGNVVEKVMGNRTTYIKGNLTEIIDGNRMTVIKGNRETHTVGNSVEQIDGSSSFKVGQGFTSYVGQNVIRFIGGSNFVYSSGDDQHHSGTSILRTAPYINDDLPQGSAPGAPADPATLTTPVLTKWPGIRGSTPV